MITPPKTALAEVIFGSCTGTTHIRNGSCCQDALSIKEGAFRGTPYLICCVADGHGSAPHCHSDQGALMATAAAEQAALQFMLSEKLSGEEFTNQIHREVKTAWVESIQKVSNIFHPDGQTIRKYGTTLLMALVYDGQVYLAQLGDGDICYLDKEKTPVFLIKPEEGPINPVTESLCSRNANKCWNMSCVPLEDVSFLMLSTDGLINSFARPSEYVRFANVLDGYFETHEPSQVNSILPDWLERHSEEGVGDDISLIALNLTPNKPNKGEDHEGKVEEAGIKTYKKIGTGRSRRSFCCPAWKRASCAKNLYKIVSHPRAAGYYLLPGRPRSTHRKVR